jgi:hypothetical protein
VDGSVTISLVFPSRASICISSEPSEADVGRNEVEGEREDEILLVGKYVIALPPISLNGSKVDKSLVSLALINPCKGTVSSPISSAVYNIT